MKYLKTSILLLLLVLSVKTNAQDKIVLRAKSDTLFVKVLEIGSEEVKYKIWPVAENNPVFVEIKTRISKIILANGTVLIFHEDEFSNPVNYTNQRTVAVKVDFLSLITGTLSLAVERSLKPGLNIETGLGIIGLNRENDYGNRQGAFLRVGAKFLNQPDYHINGMKYTHILKGAYIRPELAFVMYNKTSYNYEYISAGSQLMVTKNVRNYSSASLLLNFGKQWVMQDIFCVDVFAGIGIGIGGSRKVSSSKYLANQYYTSANESDVPIGEGVIVNYADRIGLAGQAGIKLGLLIGKKHK